MKTFILLSAIAGAGKSTWAENYKKTHKNVEIVSSDAIRFELTNQYQDFSKEEEVWIRFSRYISEARDKYDDVTVIADSTNILNKWRIKYATETEGFDKKILILINKPLDVLLKQNKQRDPIKFVPEYAIEHMWEIYEEPTEEVKAMYDEVIELN